MRKPPFREHNPLQAAFERPRELRNPAERRFSEAHDRLLLSLGQHRRIRRSPLIFDEETERFLASSSRYPETARFVGLEGLSTQAAARAAVKLNLYRAVEASRRLLQHRSLPPERAEGIIAEFFRGHGLRRSVIIGALEAKGQRIPVSEHHTAPAVFWGGAAPPLEERLESHMRSYFAAMHGQQEKRAGILPAEKIRASIMNLIALWKTHAREDRAVDYAGLVYSIYYNGKWPGGSLPEKLLFEVHSKDRDSAHSFFSDAGFAVRERKASKEAYVMFEMTPSAELLRLLSDESLARLREKISRLRK
ncbi:MAG: hypothetical protein V1787_00585 [Candidatus Micrarchaeota archaeon]